MSEKISELIDGRGAPAQRQDVFDHIIADPGAGRIWRRDHLIGCVLRGEVGPGPGGAGDGGDWCARFDARAMLKLSGRRGSIPATLLCSAQQLLW